MCSQILASDLNEAVTKAFDGGGLENHFKSFNKEYLENFREAASSLGIGSYFALITSAVINGLHGPKVLHSGTAHSIKEGMRAGGTSYEVARK